MADNMGDDIAVSTIENNNNNNDPLVHLQSSSYELSITRRSVRSQN
jgi:hypothetical protein